MKQPSYVTPISYLESRSAEMDLSSYEQQAEAKALLRVLALGDCEIEQGQYQDVLNAFSELGQTRK